jgi:hypothetical protein
MTIAYTTKGSVMARKPGFASDEAISQTHGGLLRFVNFARNDACFCFAVQL